MPTRKPRIPPDKNVNHNQFPIKVYREAPPVENVNHKIIKLPEQTFREPPRQSQPYNAYNNIQHKLIKTVCKETKRANKLERKVKAKSTIQGRRDYMDTNREKSMSESVLQTVLKCGNDEKRSMNRSETIKF